MDGSSEYRDHERRGIEQEMAKAIAEERPDVLVAGRENFAWHVPELAAYHGLPSLLLVQGGTALGILRGTYAADSATALLRRFREANAIVAVAQHLARELTRLGIPGVQAIPNPVDLRRFAPGPRNAALADALGIRDADVVVAHFSNMKPLKRPLDLVLSAEHALALDPSLLYLVVGDGPLRKEVEARCAARGLSGRFRFVDWVDHEEVPDYLGLADLVVMPSAGEGQALVYLEAHASGKTLVASDIAGAREVIEDGATGILFRVGDIDDLTEKTLLAARQPELRARIGATSRERARTHSVESVVARYEAVLETVAERRD